MTPLTPDQKYTIRTHLKVTALLLCLGYIVGAIFARVVLQINTGDTLSSLVTYLIATLTMYWNTRGITK